MWGLNDTLISSYTGLPPLVIDNYDWLTPVGQEAGPICAIVTQTGTFTCVYTDDWPTIPNNNNTPLKSVSFGGYGEGTALLTNGSVIGFGRVNRLRPYLPPMSDTFSHVCDLSYIACGIRTNGKRSTPSAKLLHHSNVMSPKNRFIALLGRSRAAKPNRSSTMDGKSLRAS
jgi:hypothetical protein